jgi:hypothetical protein
LGPELNSALFRGGQEALRVSASEEEMDLIARAIEEACLEFVRADLLVEAGAVLDGVARLGVTVHQIGPGVAYNLWAYSAPSLAAIQRAASERGATALAAEAVAAWSVVVAYYNTHFDIVHPLLPHSLAAFGANPPWEDALQVIERPDWQRKWANKLEQGIEPCRQFIEGARDEGVGQ